LTSASTRRLTAQQLTGKQLTGEPKHRRVDSPAWCTVWVVIIAVCSTKGGVAKTTVSVHLAAALASTTPGRVLLLDADASRAATRWVARGAGLPFDAHTIDTAPDDARREAAHTVVDTPGAESTSDLVELARLADRVIIPTPPTPLDLVGALDTVNLLAPVADVRVLLTRCPPPRQRDESDARALLEVEQVRVLRVSVPNRKPYQHAALIGATVASVPGGAALWRVWAEITKGVLEQ
jgi:cellulose biosynthesis protein BcsQ